MKRNLYIGAITGLCLTPAIALAYFEVKDAPAPANPAPAQVALPSEDMQMVATRRIIHLVELGDRQMPTPVAGFGENIPLAVAVEMVMPEGWVALASPKVDTQNQFVSWTGGKPWTETLRDFGEATKTSMTVDWARNEVLIRPIEVETALERAAMTAPVVTPAPPVPVHGAGVEPLPMPAGNETIDVASLDMESSPATVIRVSTAHAAAQMTLEEFLNQSIMVDVRGATAIELIEAMLPSGWEAEPVAFSDRMLNRRIDYTAPLGEPRGAAMGTIGRELGLVITPFTHLQKVVVTEVQ